MIKGLPILLAAVLVAMTTSQDPVVLSGTAIDCVRGEIIRIPGLEVRALNPATHQNLMDVLQRMDTLTWAGDGSEAMGRFEPMYEQMVGLLKSSTPLALDSTAVDGTFTLAVPSSDSVLVIAQMDIEDVTAYWAHMIVGARNGVAFELDMARGRCRTQGTIQRTADGLILHDDFDRANGAPGANWEIRGNTAFWSIAGNVLKGKPTDATLQQILVASTVFGAPRGEMVVQARMRRVGTARTTFPGIQARHDAVGVNWFRWVVTNSGDNSQDEFHRTLSGGSAVLNTSSSYNANNVWQQYKLAVKDGQQQAWKDGVLKVNLTNTSLNAVTGRAGLSTGWYTSTSDYHEYDDFAVYKGNTVTITGLPAGHKLRVGARVVVESGGTATVDLLEDLSPRVMIEVLNAGGLSVLQHTPTGGVWGGDTYSYTQ